MHPIKSCVCALGALVLTLPAASAADMGGISIHGSLSATAAESDQYNFYGNTDGKFALIQKELTLNGAYRFESGLRASAQIYAADTAGQSSLMIDFANLDYAFNQKFGVRVGRNKLPLGLYNEVLDVDQIRIFASLPLGFYPRGLRSLDAGYNGGAIYGTWELGAKAGSLEYQAFGGGLNNVDKNAPFLRGFTPPGMLTNGADGKGVYGASAIWNTPVDGLRAGYTYTHIAGAQIENLLNFPPLVGQPATTTIDAIFQVGSVEYAHGKWTAVAEYKFSREPSSTDIPALGVNHQRATGYATCWYVQLTYQATNRLGLGVYYNATDNDPKNTDPRDGKFTTLKDTAVATSYAITSWWVVKAEYHFLNGLGTLGEAGDSNPAASKAGWNYLVLKTTLSF